MGLFDFLAAKPKAGVAQLPSIVQQIDARLEVLREQYVFAVLSSLQGEGATAPGVPKVLEQGTEVDSVLRGFQLTVIVGFSWKYMDLSLCQVFDTALTERFDNGDAEAISRYREAYLDCEGNVAKLTERLAHDVFRLWGQPRPRETFLKGLVAGAKVLAILSQAGAAGAFGDSRTERTLRALVGGA